MTNIEKIKNMNAKELARLMFMNVSAMSKTEDR